MNSLLPSRIEAVQSPRVADERTLRMCFSERDAVAASVALSGLTYREIASRMGVSKSLVDLLIKGHRTLTKKRTIPFCHATGTLLVQQYREMERAMNEARGRVKEHERIAAIVAPTQRMWGEAA